MVIRFKKFNGSASPALFLNFLEVRTRFLFLFKFFSRHPKIYNLVRLSILEFPDLRNVSALGNKKVGFQVN